MPYFHIKQIATPVRQLTYHTSQTLGHHGQMQKNR